MPTQEIQTQTIGQLNLLNIIRQVTNSIGENLPFGHGMRSYANLERRSGILENEKIFPRCYLYPVTISGEIVNGKIQNTFECAMDFLDQAMGGELKCTPEVIETVLTEMFRLSTEFIEKLESNIKVIAITDLVREPNYFVFDANLCGWLVTFKIQLYEPEIC